MKKLLLALAIVMCSLVVFAGPSQAGTASANLTVSVDVDSACTISTVPVGFPTYTPIGANFSAPDDSTSGSVTIICTTGTSSTIGLGAGNYASGGQSRLSDGISSFLNYNLYQDASHLNAWGNTSPTWMTVIAAPNTSPRTYPVYARIPAGQSGGGHYTDTVVATVNF